MGFLSNGPRNNGRSNLRAQRLSALVEVLRQPKSSRTDITCRQRNKERRSPNLTVRDVPGPECQGCTRFARGTVTCQLASFAPKTEHRPPLIEQRSLVFRYPHRYPEQFRRPRVQAAKTAQAFDLNRKNLVLPNRIELSTSPLPIACSSNRILSWLLKRRSGRKCGRDSLWREITK